MGVAEKGVAEEERDLAGELVELDEKHHKIVALPHLTESENPKERVEGQFRALDMGGVSAGDELGYILDVDPRSMEDPGLKEIVGSAGTIFVNAVMGLTPPFPEGTRALYSLIASNRDAIFQDRYL